MSADPVRAIANAVLYEGYLLWPYRRSALKNQQRFTFGGVYPRAFAQQGGDRHVIRMECLAEGPPEAHVELTLRFLHLAAVGPWEEAIERELRVGPLSLADLHDGTRRKVAFAAGADTDVRDGEPVERRWDALDGMLELTAVPCGDGVARLCAVFTNLSAAPVLERREALRHTFLSAHLVVHTGDAALVSQTDPPEALRDHVDACRNEGLWPVLVGADGERNTLLASPIILSDYPQVAPESPGDLFDGGEIDVLLIHSIRALTDDERDEMAATDPRAREILERSMALPPEKMLELWGGAVRELRPRGD